MTIPELKALPTAEMRLESARQLLAEKDAELVRLRARVDDLLQVNNAELERRRQAERERQNIRESWERAWVQPTTEEYRQRIRDLLCHLGKFATYRTAAEAYIVCLRQIVYSGIDTVKARAGIEITSLNLAGKLEDARAALAPMPKHEATGEQSEGTVGNPHFKRYRPKASLTLPEYTSHSGQVVKVIRQLDEDEAERGPGLERVFLIRAAGGWEGHAFQSELEIVLSVEGGNCGPERERGNMRRLWRRLFFRALQSGAEFTGDVCAAGSRGGPSPTDDPQLSSPGAEAAPPPPNQREDARRG